MSADERLSGDPFLLPDMQPAVTRIYRALLSGENIAIYGDFDVDGITATTLLVKGLSTMGGKVIHRFHREGGLYVAEMSIGDDGDDPSFGGQGATR